MVFKSAVVILLLQSCIAHDIVYNRETVASRNAEVVLSSAQGCSAILSNAMAVFSRSTCGIDTSGKGAGHR